MTTASRVQAEVEAWFNTPLGQQWLDLINEIKGRVPAWDESYWIYMPVTRYDSLVTQRTALELMPRYITHTSMQEISREIAHILYEEIWGRDSIRDWHEDSAYRYLYLSSIIDK